MYRNNPLNHVLSGPQQDTMSALMGSDLVNQASLFVFSPRIHNPQFKRSYVYNLSSDLCDQVVDTISESLTGRADINQMAFMHGSADANTAILPNAHGIPINMSTFSELWTFLLVIDVQKGSRISHNVNKYMHILPCDARFLYMGYCDDEPINPVNMGGSPSINPRSVMIITHHSYIHRTMQVDPQRSIPIVSTMTDVDIIPTELVRQSAMSGAPAPEYYAAPSKLVSSMSQDNTMSLGYNSNLINIDGAEEAHLSNYKSNIPSVASLNSPRHHLRDIVRTLSDCYIHAADTVYGVNDYDRDTVYLSSVRSNLMSEHAPTTITVAPLDPNSPVTLSTIMAMYPNLVVNDCRIPQTSQWDVVSQEAPNVVNIYSSLISSTLPPLLVANSISQISFRYSSINPNNSFSSLDKDDQHELFDIATFVQLSPEMLKQKYMSLLRYLKQTLFPIVKAAGGDFDLLVYTSVAGTNIISLKFFNFPTLSVDNAYYESYNSLGGIMSPVVNTNEEFIHNATHLSNMIRQVAPES